MSFLTKIRIYNDPSDKRPFERQIIQDFNIYDNAVEMKKSVFEATESLSRWMTWILGMWERAITSG